MLVNCVAYQDGRKLAEIQKREIRAYLERPGCFVWVALKDADAPELTEMQDEFDLHALAIEDTHHGKQRPKIEEYGDSLFAVLHTVEVAGDDLQVGELDIFVGPNYVLSARQKTARGFQDVRARCEREPELLRHGPGYVFYALVDAVVDRYLPALDAVEAEFEALEEQIFTGKSPGENIEALYYVKQKLMTLKHAAGPLLDAASRLYSGRVPHACAGLGDYFRDVYDHLFRLNQSLDTLRDTVTTAIQVNLAMITIGESEVTKRLAAYAALVAVPAMIAGIYGMNFKIMPELQWSFGYPLAIAVMATLDVYLFYRFRKAGWL
jgi:magnesium transporter